MSDANGNSQGIDVSSLAAGERELNFDSLGVKLTIATDAATGADADLDGLTVVVSNAGGGSAKFQVGTDNGTDTIDIASYFQNTSLSNTTDFSTLDADISALSTSDDFGALTSLVDDAISTVSGWRSDLGSMQNRLDHNISNLQAQSENLAAANSRILDTDYASETANLTKGQIMQQASSAMLAQANQMPNVILSLLK